MWEGGAGCVCVHIMRDRGRGAAAGAGAGLGQGQSQRAPCLVWFTAYEYCIVVTIVNRFLLTLILLYPPLDF